MLKLLLALFLLILATLTACSGQTPTPETQAQTFTPAPTESPTASDRPTQSPAAVATATPASPPSPEPTPTPATVPQATSVPTPTPTEPAKNPGDQPTPRVITPMLTDEFENVLPELSGSELACMEETADTERLSRILAGQAEPAPEQWNVILDCLHDETQLRTLVGAFAENPGPLSTGASECMRTALQGVNLRLVMVAATQDDEMDYTLLSGVFATVACLNYEDWDIASKVFDLDPGERQVTVCLMGAMGRTRGLTAALEAKDEGGSLTQLAQETGCEMDKDGESGAAPVISRGTPEPGPDPATPEPDNGPVITTVILVAPVPPDIPEYDHSQWKHRVDADGDCQDTGQEALVRESLSEVTFETDKRCRVETGWWHGAFTRTRVNNASELDVVHRVPLRNAHRSGGWAWPTDKKKEYANYLDANLHLVAVTTSVNRSRGAKGPEEWRPPDQVFWCEYALYWAAVKTKWELTMSGEEANAVKEMLDTCPGEVRVIEIKG